MINHGNQIDGINHGDRNGHGDRSGQRAGAARAASRSETFVPGASPIRVDARRLTPAAHGLPAAAHGLPAAAHALPAIHYRVASLGALTVSDLEPEPDQQVEVQDSAPRATRRRAPSRLMIDGEPVVTTPRFWWSLFMRCGLNEAVFRYFEPTEVFKRVARLDAGKSVRFAIEGIAGSSRPRRLLAVSAPSGPLLTRERAAELVDRYGGDRVGYADGVLSAMHTPVVEDRALRIGPDEFKNRFHIEVPVDGLGEPRIHVALMRLVCDNGAIAMRSAFRSMIRIGKDPEHSLERALSHYSNDDGFSAMRQRFESAQRSWASLREVRLLENELSRISWGVTDGAAVRKRAFRAMVGDYESRYGLASIEALSVKRQRLLQASCRMYDLINFATEMATHHAPPLAAARLHGWLGGTISEEFDLENTANDTPDFVELFTEVPGRTPAEWGASRN